MPTRTHKDACIDKLQKHPKVRVCATDMDGILRGKYMHTKKVLSSLEEGFGFCSVIFGWDSNDVCYDNSTFSGWHNGYPDTLAKPDLRAQRSIPWNNNIPLLLADFWLPKDKPLPICPRQILKRVEERAANLGFQTNIGVEFEWFNFQETPESLKEKAFRTPKPLTPGMFGYSILRSSLYQQYFDQIIDFMNAAEVPLEGLHTETGPGVYEAALRSTTALEAGDRAD